MKAAPLSKKKEKSLCLLIVSIFIDFIYFFSLKTKANPSPNGNGFAFNLFGEHKRNESELVKMNHWRYCYCSGMVLHG